MIISRFKPNAQSAVGCEISEILNRIEVPETITNDQNYPTNGKCATASQLKVVRRNLGKRIEIDCQLAH